MSSNGQLNRSELGSVPGGLLRKDAAKAFNALNKRVGGKLRHAGAGATYRVLGRPGDYARGGPFTQWYAWERYQKGGNLAARPGTSNHGAAVAVDFDSASIELVRQYGAAFGWKKTEAFGEPWHWCYVPGNYSAIDRYSQKQAGETIKAGDTGPAVVALKKRLRIWGAWPRAYRIDSGFGGRTKAQVVAFQKARHLIADGVVGPTTWAALNAKPPVLKKAPLIRPKIPKALPHPNANYFADIYAGDSNYDPVAYAKAGYQRIALKATEGKTFTDPEFTARWNASAHLIRWAYHFARPHSNSAVDEAANFAKSLNGVHFLPGDRVVLDWEDERYSGDGSHWVQQFVDVLHKSYGHEVRVLYSGGPYIEATLPKWPRSKSGPLKYWHAAYVSLPERYVPARVNALLTAVQYTDGSAGNQPRAATGIGNCDMSYNVRKK